MLFPWLHVKADYFEGVQINIKTEKISLSANRVFSWSWWVTVAFIFPFGQVALRKRDFKLNAVFFLVI